MEWIEALPDEQRVVADALQAALAPEIELDSLLGVGGMGAVFSGREVALDRRVAIKVLAPTLAQTPLARERFRREAQAAAAVFHPHVVSVFRVGELPGGGAPYFVMQQVSGRSLDLLFPEGRPATIPDVRRIIGQVASALAAAHHAGLVHRDIKPANILMDEDSGRVVVADFGISASRSTDTEDARLTQQGQVVGTPRYLSPEAAAGEEVGPAADIYALGCVAFELLTGRPVFPGSNPAQVVARHIRDTPEPLRALRPELPSDEARVVDRMLAKDPAARPTADEVARMLLPQALPFAWPPPGMERVQGMMRRHGWWVTAATTLGILPVAVALGFGADTAVVSSPNAVIPALLLLFIPIVATVGGFLSLSVISNAVLQGWRAGLPVRLTLEVLADPGDTGALIGAQLRYAALRPREIEAKRSARTWSAMLLASSGLLVTASLCLVVWLGPRFGWPARSAAWVALGALGSSLLLALVLASRGDAPHEDRDSFRLRRRPSRQLPLNDGEISAWRAAAAKRFRVPERWRFGGIALLVLDNLGPVPGLGVVALLVFLAVVGVLQAVSRTTNAEPVIRALAIARAWPRVPPTLLPEPDSTITPTEAGRLAYLLLRPADFQHLRWLPPDSTPARRLRAVDGASAAFGAAYAGDGRWARLFIIARSAGFDSAQRRFLAAVAGHEDTAAFTRLARAPRMALYDHLLGPGRHVRRALYGWTPTRGVAVANATMARAALAVADGRMDESLALVRAVFGVGHLLMTDGREHLDFLTGTRMVRMAAGGYGVLASAGAAPIAGVTTFRVPDAADVTAAILQSEHLRSPKAQDRWLREIAADTTVLPALRLVAAEQLVRRRCVGPFASIFATPRAEAEAALLVGLDAPGDEALRAYVRDSLLSASGLASSVDGGAATEPGQEIELPSKFLGWVVLSGRGAACLRTFTTPAFYN